MRNSAADPQTTSNVTYLPIKERAATASSDVVPLRFPWTEELERRRKAVARWRGAETFKRTMRD